MKTKYIAPGIKIIQLATDNNIAQFVVSSHSVPENGGLSKPDLINEDSDDSEELGNVGYNKMWED